ncbi:MAG: DUF4173 domain-containing protein [Chloroflexota bacterium]
MRDETRLGLLALVAAGLLGLLGDLLLGELPWGLNALLWIVALVSGVALLLWQARMPLLGESRWLAIPALLFAAAIAVRDSQTLLVVNVLAVLLTLALAAHRAAGGWPVIGGLPQYLGAAISAGFHACGGAIVLACYDVRWKEIPRTGWSAVVLAVLRGMLIAIPLLVVFGGLFMAADAVFSGLIRNAFAIDVRQAFSHVFWTGFWAWLTAGFLRQALFCTIAGKMLAPQSPETALTPQPPRAVPAAGEGELVDSSPDLPLSAPETGLGGDVLPPSKPKLPGGRIGLLGLVELGIVLGLLDLLFLAFVIVQFRYLFGGAELVQVSESLTYAEYARRGFFELVAVAALLLPIVLFLDWLGRLTTPREMLVYRILAGLLVVLLFVVIVSALQRMRLYTEEYGLTELRLYTTAFMLWITVCAGWYLATVLRNRRERFLFGGLVAGLLVAATLDMMNPDDLIVRTNAARHDAPTRFDGAYTMLLSSDASPAVIEALPYIPEYQRVMVAQRLIRRWESGQKEDWRTWNYGRWRAYVATAEHEAQLRELAQRPNSQPSVTPRSRSSSRDDVYGAPGPDDRP